MKLTFLSKFRWVKNIFKILNLNHFSKKLYGRNVQNYEMKYFLVEMIFFFLKIKKNVPQFWNSAKVLGAAEKLKRHSL